jgi:hypothetical protein
MSCVDVGLQKCPSGVTIVSQVCYSDVTVGYQHCSQPSHLHHTLVAPICVCVCV